MSTTPEILDYVKVTKPDEAGQPVSAASGTGTGTGTTRALKPKATEPGMKCETKDFYKTKDSSAWTHK
jgi:hypothetical protein